MSEKVTRLYGRRNAIKAIGAGVASIGVLPNGTRASGKSPYVGLVYDPNTHEILGNVEGKLGQARQQLKGILNFPNREVKLDQERPNSVRKSRGKKNSHFKKSLVDNPKNGKSKKNKSIMKTITGNDGGLTGYIEPTTGRTVAFSLRKETSGAREDIQRLIERTGEGGE